MTTFTMPTASQLSELITPLVDGEHRVDFKEAYAALVWAHMTEPDDADAQAYIARNGGTLWAALSVAVHDDSDKVVGQLARIPVDRLGLERMKSEGIRFTYRGHALYPQSLYDLRVPPFALFYRGDISLLHATRRVAIVGARAATSYGEHATTSLVSALPHSTLVVSGAAYGIDGAAHRTALSVGLPTVAFLAGGVDRPYPAGHADLISRIPLVVSEVPVGSSPTKWRFLSRNRLIAALGQTTVVVEAGHRSGSINTAAHAESLRRPLGAVPGPITSVASAGCHRLMKEYGAACITTSADIVELAGWNA